jgi:hypothetical protein
VIGPTVVWLAVGVAGITATGSLLARDWRWQLGMMAAQYSAAALLASTHWPPGMAVALLVTGWISIAVIGMTLTTVPTTPGASAQAWPEGRAFRLFMAGMIVVLAAGVASRGALAPAGVEAPVLAAAILMSGIGALQLGSSAQTSRIVLGLLTVLSGFEVYYSAIEGSILVAGLLSLVVLGLGLVGAYLLTAATPEDSA